MNVTNGAHLAVGGSCGTQLSEGKREEQDRVGRSFRVVSLTGSHRGVLAWHASSAKMANVILKLLSCGKYVRGILKMAIKCAAIIRTANI